MQGERQTRQAWERLRLPPLLRASLGIPRIDLSLVAWRTAYSVTAYSMTAGVAVAFA